MGMTAVVFAWKVPVDPSYPAYADRLNYAVDYVVVICTAQQGPDGPWRNLIVRIEKK